MINPVEKTPKRSKTAHSNWMGGPSWDVSNPLMRLRMAASSCFFGEPMYYHIDEKDKRPRRRSVYQKKANLTPKDLMYLRSTLNAVDPQEWRSLGPAELMESTIDAALAHDPEGTLQVAVDLRNRDYIRTTPQVILVRAAHAPNVRGTGLIVKYAPQIIRRADEPAVQMAYQIARYGARPIPNQLKKAWRNALGSTPETLLAKYRMESRRVKTVDVVNISHPASDAVNKLVCGTLTLDDQTWEAVISAGGKWEDVIPRMNHMGLLRNLRNFSEKKVSTDLYIPRLLQTRKGSMQLPFRYFSAYKAVEGAASPVVLDAIEQCLVESFDEAPHFDGRVMSLCDNSGSAWGTTTSSMGTMHIAEIGNLTGIITGNCADEGYAGVFGDRLKTFPVRKRSSVFEQTNNLNSAGRGIGGGTENGIWLFWDKAIKTKEHWDHVFIYSDMQAGHGGLYGMNPSDYRDYSWSNNTWGGYRQYIDVPKLINKYRQEVNPNVFVYLVQIAGYNDTIVPEFYDRTYILGGWGDGILRFASAMSSAYQ